MPKVSFGDTQVFKQHSTMDPLVDQLPSRYVVGIDLGTTNSAVSFVDTEESPWQVRVLQVPQLIGPGEVDRRPTLPSFHFEPAAGLFSKDALSLPWNRDDVGYAVGEFARNEGSKTSGRMIASAKSWLCHPGVDRTAPLLPWHGAEDVERLSPVDVSARYLLHIRHAWDAQFASAPLEEQDIVLTLPASFDEVARELTVEAAARAGLPRIVLIEEPQAAFYAWVHKHGDDWDQRVAPGQKILICDIGGGTTDFTLIRVRRSGEGGAEASSDGQQEESSKVQFHRVAVGNHLILGGDNLDLALAQYLEQKLAAGTKLAARQWDVLIAGCRRAKEEMLGDSPVEKLTLHLPAAGAKLIGGGMQVEVTREEVLRVLVDGFLPEVPFDDRPRKRASGFQEFGLPYAADPAITRYLGSFLAAHARESTEVEAATPPTGVECTVPNHEARPDVVLFNGGFFASPDLRTRLLDVLGSWFRDASDPDWAPLVLDNERLDLAVARGAAYYGMVRRGEGVRIAASLARSYYIHVESDTPTTVCLVPGFAEPGQEFALPDHQFHLTVSEPVEFPLYVSSTRLADKPGELVPVDREQMTPLPPIRTVLKTRSRREAGWLPVTLHSRLTEIGTIELSCHEVGGSRSWKLQFDVRAAVETDRVAEATSGETAGLIDEATWAKCLAAITDVFGDQPSEKPARLMQRLADALEAGRAQWPMSALRRIWEALMEYSEGRRRSQSHEARWLNLLGYSLRPGYGLAVDDWRVAETWRNVRGKLVHATPAIQNESMILWRRIAGGLSPGQQLALAEPLLTAVRALHRRLHEGKPSKTALAASPEESPEIWRLLGSLELLSVGMKIELGDMLVNLLPKRRLEKVRGVIVWTLGRLGQRVPVHGPLNVVVPADTSSRWLTAVMQQPKPDGTDLLAVMQLARRTDDRYRDVSPQVQTRVADWLTDHQAPDHYLQLVQEGGRLADDEQDRVLGESLPKGLRIA